MKMLKLLLSFLFSLARVSLSREVIVSQVKRYIACYLVGISSILLFVNSVQATTITLQNNVSCIASLPFSCTGHEGLLRVDGLLLTPTCRESCSMDSISCLSTCFIIRNDPEYEQCLEKCSIRKDQCLDKC